MKWTVVLLTAAANERGPLLPCYDNGQEGRVGTYGDLETAQAVADEQNSWLRMYRAYVIPVDDGGGLG
jgi:hypothetical protein